MPKFMSRSQIALVMGAMTFVVLFSYQGHADNVMSGAATCPRAREVPKNDPQATTINIPHIFCGSINKRGKATGYHHRREGQDSTTARIGQVMKINELTGVYVAKGISVWDGTNWRLKNGISSFFPDGCTVEQVINSIRHAASNVECRYKNGKWSGHSAPANDNQHQEGHYCLGRDGSILTIQGYFRKPDRIVATAWPLVGPIKGNCIAE